MSQELTVVEKNDPEDMEDLILPTLTQQEKRFCLEYIVDYNHNRAAEVAGYSRSSGLYILRKPQVAAYLDKVNEQVARSSLITRDRYEYELEHEFLPRAKGEIPIHAVTSEGIPYEAKITNMAAYGKAVDQMGKVVSGSTGSKAGMNVSIHIDHAALGITVEGEAEDVG